MGRAGPKFCRAGPGRAGYFRPVQSTSRYLARLACVRAIVKAGCFFWADSTRREHRIKRWQVLQGVSFGLLNSVICKVIVVGHAARSRDARRCHSRADFGTEHAPNALIIDYSVKQLHLVKSHIAVRITTLHWHFPFSWRIFNKHLQ